MQPAAAKPDQDVKVKHNRAESTVSFEYHPAAAQRVARIEGAEFDAEKRVWRVPAVQRAELDKAIADVQRVLAADRAGRIDIEKLVSRSARALLSGRDTPDAEIRISDFHDRSRAAKGEILNANAHWAAQLTGFGHDDGAAFITLHRMAEISQAVFKGDRVAVRYDDKGKGHVESMAPDFTANLGKEVDGVKVVLADDKFEVSFDYDPAMSARINRIAGVAFNDDKRCYEVPKEHEEFLKRAVADMRGEHVRNEASLAEMRTEAKGKIDGAKVVAPYRERDSVGPIVASNERHVLQHTGREYFTAHRTGELDRVPSVNEQVRIAYDKGRGTVHTGRTQNREAGHGR